MNDVTTFKASLTSFSRLPFSLGVPDGGRVEIPLIQRDYAQGRRNPNVDRIRSQFIGTVCAALTPDAEPLHLDFVYGDLEASGAFIPLDGQQRLTMMFLLHCYLAWRTGVRVQDEAWAKFTYSTRPGARAFCEFLVTCAPSEGKPSEWLTDSPDYLPTWDDDPTVQSMLVVLDALHEHLVGSELDVNAAWQRLTSPNEPAIQFHVLPMRASGLTDELYIKMNSRGKPLTAFENFKAQFADVLRHQDAVQAHDFSLRVDTVWSKVFWPYRGEDDLIDDEMMRYFRMVTEINAWLSSVQVPSAAGTDAFSYISQLSAEVYGEAQARRDQNLDFMFRALNVWVGRDPGEAHTSILTHERSRGSTRLQVFAASQQEDLNLFERCCKHYGSRDWDLADTLMLYAVILYLDRQPDDPLLQRLRTVRNLIEASRADEIRVGDRNSMSALLVDVERLVLRDELADVKAFNQAQKANEFAKQAFLQKAPELRRELCFLEDHHLLRGGLTAFDLDPATFITRALAFETLFDPHAQLGPAHLLPVTGALLAHGEYARVYERGSGYRTVDLGSPRNAEPWRVLFRGKVRRQNAHPMTGPLMGLLDAIAGGSTLDAETARLQSSTQYDWRYYLCKYPQMRSGASGRYVVHPSGYEACMLELTQLKSYYADPFLSALVSAAGIERLDIGNERWPNSFFGWESNHRWLLLKKNGLQIRSLANGWELVSVPDDARLEPLLREFDIQRADNGTALLRVRQSDGLDTEDRIELAARFLRAVQS